MGICVNKCCCLSKHGLWREWSVLFICLILALWLRLGELKRMEIKPLDPDVRDYIELAQKIKPFTDTGFYSAQFGMREPLYLLVVKLFFLLPGPSEVNIRFVSFVFSILVVFLTYFLVRSWMGKTVGFVAAFLLAFQTYFIELSVRGLRCEFFTFLFLLLIYITIIKPRMNTKARTIWAGVLTGLICLTRTEFLIPAALFFISLPIIERQKWNGLKAIVAFCIGLFILFPHLWGMHRVHGDFFYTNNQNARFFTNLEFGGKPGFPTKEDINQYGFYTGPKVTAFDYFFRFHGIQELFWGNLLGMGKIYALLGLRYIPTQTWHTLRTQKGNIRKQAKFLLFRHPFRSLLAVLVGFSFLWGIFLIWGTKYCSLYVVLILFQVQTAFLLSVGLETRAVIHTWPVALWITAFLITFAVEKILERLNYPVGRKNKIFIKGGK